MVLRDDEPGWIFPYVSTFGSWGKWDCQACRNHGFNHKYCWRPVFQVNKQQPAYSAALGLEYIRWAKFKALRWEPSPIIIFRVCFGVEFKWYWEQATVCVYIMLISVYLPEIRNFRMGLTPRCEREITPILLPFWNGLKGDESLSTWPSALLRKIAKYVI